jgi:hypothetical protein
VSEAAQQAAAQASWRPPAMPGDPGAGQSLPRMMPVPFAGLSPWKSPLMQVVPGRRMKLCHLGKETEGWLGLCTTSRAGRRSPSDGYPLGPE